MYTKELAYVQVIDLLGIPRNKKKDCYGTVVSVFGIEVDISTFTAKLLQDKLKKAIEKTGEILNNSSNSISYFEIMLLIGFLSFCFHAMGLGRVFICRL